MGYIVAMEIVETPVFTADIVKLIPDESYRQLQRQLVEHPGSGDLIPGSGGLRKIRWRLSGRGKSGGIRVIYYLDMPDTIFMLFVYRKNQQEDLTQQQLKYLRNLIREWLG
jgi:hypothetical protein